MLKKLLKNPTEIQKIAQNKKIRVKKQLSSTIVKQQIIITTQVSVTLLIWKKTRGTQLAAKKITKKYRNLAKKKPYQRSPPRTETTEFNDLETTDYNNDTSVDELNDIVSNRKKGKNTQLTAKKIF